MVGHRLTSRLEALEHRSDITRRLPAVWTVAEPGEVEADTIARHERQHGSIGDRMALIWRPATGGAPCVA